MMKLKRNGLPNTASLYHSIRSVAGSRMIFPLALIFGALSLISFSGEIASGSTIVTTKESTLSSADQKQMDDEVKQGKQASTDLAKTLKFTKNQSEIDRVNAIGQRLATVADVTKIPAGYGNDKLYPFIWHFFVIQDDDVNAFSLPGGYVYVNTGLLKNVRSDQELAGVLAHEITHVMHHHIQSLAHEQSKLSTETMIALIAALAARVPPEALTGAVETGSLLSERTMNTHFGQAAERDADHGGTMLMAKAGYNPVGMLTFMQNLADLRRKQPDIDYGIFQDHPYESDRVTAIQAELKEMNVVITPKSLRETTGAPVATVVNVDPVTKGIDMGTWRIATLSDRDGSRSMAAVRILNELLDDGVQLYQVKADGDSLVVADRAIITFTSDDTSNISGVTPQTLAYQASTALRKQMWAQTIQGRGI